MKSILSDLKWISISLLLVASSVHIWLIPTIAIGAVLFYLLYKSFQSKKKYTNSDGYVVLYKNNKFEHRHIAEVVLKRKLNKNEVVHHINGNPKVNKTWNLCVMDHEKHELFHVWLKWKKDKLKSYPPFSEQKRILVKEYGAILLESYTASSNQKSQKNINNGQLEYKISTQKKLFNELRKERRRLAIERSIPVYLICDNRTLSEICETMPISEFEMMKITGIGPIKFKMYGEFFIKIVKDFKQSLNSESDFKVDA